MGRKWQFREAVTFQQMTNMIITFKTIKYKYLEIIMAYQFEYASCSEARSLQ